ncbi:kelch-like protein 9 [Anneissia japonica]|uniref:kelch-like protein 9 n=1 Tax=Anneissia japonica TaxID=1529436 RepID=UPI0014259CDC|nr:kelch-like protein 9 [Anneissia japonica]
MQNHVDEAINMNLNESWSMNPGTTASSLSPVNNLSPRRERRRKISMKHMNLGLSPRRRPSRRTGKGSHVMDDLNRLRLDGHYCDVTLIVDNKRHLAHKNILAASSPYFQELFVTDGNKSASEFMLTGISSHSLAVVLGVVYTSSVDEADVSDLDSLSETLRTAYTLRIDLVNEVCGKFMLSRLKCKNCIDYFKLTKDYHIDEARREIVEFITKNFGEVIEKKLHLPLSCHQIIYFLSRDDILAKSEISIFEAVMEWLKDDWQDRKDYAPLIMTHIRFPLIHPNDIVNKVQTEEIVMDIPECRILITEAMSYHLLPHHQHSFQTLTRATNDVLIVLGGEDMQGLTSEQTYVCDIETHAWKPFTDMPIRRLDLAVAIMDNFLYVAGGQFSGDSLGIDSIGTVHQYNPRFDTWRQLCPMKKRRSHFSLDGIDTYLYAVGGKNTQGGLASVERYDSATDSWDYVAPLTLHTFGHGSAVVGDNLYMSGGVVDGGHFSNALQCYDPKRDKWTFKKPMSTKRAFHVMCSVGKKIYVIGGNTRNNENRRIDCRSVECYDTTTEQWSKLSPITHGVSLAGIGVHGKCIYVIGGYTGKFSDRHSEVQMYDVEGDKWTVISNMPEGVIRHRCCLLAVPQSRLL